MKKHIAFPLLIALFGLPLAAKAQFNFGVSPGLTMNSAQFGYRFAEDWVPYVGLQYYNVNYEFTDFDFQQEFSGSLLIPTLGLKYFAIDKSDLQGYFNVNFSKPLVFGSASIDGQDDPAFDELLDGLSFWGGEFGFGAEYFFSKQFSVGGEFGLRWIRVNNEQSTEIVVDFDPNTGEAITATEESDLALNINPTYARFTFNFYFE